MYDRELVRDILLQILEATRRIARRFAPISSVADFLRSEEGLEKLDAICMQLIAIGEGIKHIDKITRGALL
ncbi:MAG: antitoxin, partial [Anaerolineae bacterium]